jgi:hypothetical protein
MMHGSTRVDLLRLGNKNILFSEILTANVEHVYMNPSSQNTLNIDVPLRLNLAQNGREHVLGPRSGRKLSIILLVQAGIHMILV